MLSAKESSFVVTTSKGSVSSRWRQKVKKEKDFRIENLHWQRGTTAETACNRSARKKKKEGLEKSIPGWVTGTSTGGDVPPTGWRGHDSQLGGRKRETRGQKLLSTKQTSRAMTDSKIS